VRFTAPVNTTIVSASLNRGLFTGLDQDWRAYTASSNGDIEVCRSTMGFPACRVGGSGTPTNPTRRDYFGLNATWLSVGIYCEPNDLGSCSNITAYPIALAAVHQASVTLEDLHAPTYSGSPSGPLMTTTSWQPGTLGLTVPATSDLGGGVRSVRLVVDGVPQGGAAASISSCDFTFPVPCPLVRSAVDLALDTRTLADGHHSVFVRLEDAAGNVNDTAPWSIRIDYGAPAAPTGVSAQGSTGTPLTVTWTNPPSASPVNRLHWALTPIDGGGGAASGQTEIQGASAVLPAVSRDGRFRLDLRLEDAAGNTNPANLASIIVDTTVTSAPPWLDTDRDGTPDHLDRCPTRIGGSNNNGCPLDSGVRPVKRTNVLLPMGRARYHGGYRAALVPVRALPWDRTILVRVRKGGAVSQARLVKVRANKRMLIVPAPKAQRIPTRVEWRPVGEKKWRALNIIA